MTLTQLLADLYRKTGYASSPAAETTTRMTAHLNEALQDVISEPGIGAWLTLNQPPVTFASVANQAVYAIPQGVQRIDAITERTNDLRLELRDLDWYRRVEPDPAANTGTPTVWVPFGFMAVAAQPAAATGLWAVSTSASDTTQTVRVETVRTGGVTFSGSLSLNGVTRVQLGTATDHEQITKFYLSAVGVGTIEIYDAAAAGNRLGLIPIGQTFSRYSALALWPTPAAVITYYVDGERPLPDMSNGTDEPPFPPRFHRLLVDGALWYEWNKKDDDRAGAAFARFERGRKQLRYFLTCPPDYLPSRGASVERSRLGGQYPATRW